ncbi:MAG: ABC transporter permease [Aeromicrobium sp.]|uniref:ABC transporter permease n=1 Tax=Aeromicrobium sp. TaxID=1871063 RepID=UPI0039E33CC0
MLSYTAKRLALVVPTLLFVSLVTFALAHFSASDPITAKYSYLGITPDPAVLARERAAAGLNDPFLVQYARWLFGAIHGDFGESYAYGADAGTEVLRRLPRTIWLAVATLVTTIMLALPMGLVAACYHGRWPDTLVRLFSFCGAAMPSFWVGLLLMYQFAVRWSWLPVMGSSSPRHIILPTATLTFWLAALYVRRLRGSLLEELGKDYVVGAIARGVPRHLVLWRDVLPNALISVLPLVGLSVGALLGGATIVESIFAWQGIGKMAVAATTVRDYPVLMAYVTWVSVIFVVANAAVDLLGRAIDPQARRAATGTR